MDSEAKYRLFQVQLETKNRIYSLEVPCPWEDFDAREIAEVYLAVTYDDYGPFHLGGYKEIGTAVTDDIVDNSGY